MTIRVLVPTKDVHRCAYCRDLLGEKRHPMLPPEPKQDHCTCALVTVYRGRGKVIQGTGDSER